MKIILFIPKIYFFILIVCASASYSQSSSPATIDSLKALLTTDRTDSSKIYILHAISDKLLYVDPDSSFYYGEQAIKLAKEIGSRRLEAFALTFTGDKYRMIGNLPKALELKLKAIAITKEINDTALEAECLIGIGPIFSELKDINKALYFVRQGKDKFEFIHDTSGMADAASNLAGAFNQLNQLDSALYYEQMAYHFATITRRENMGFIYGALGGIYAKMGNINEAKKNLTLSLRQALKYNDKRSILLANSGLASFYLIDKQPDSAIFYAGTALSLAQSISYKSMVIVAANTLANSYKSKGDFLNAFKYLELMVSTEEELYGRQVLNITNNIFSSERERQQELKAAQESYKDKTRQYLLLGAIFMLLTIAVIIYLNNLKKQKANKLLSKQKDEIQLQRDNLKSTQAQLIQSEKMASLGELTAGIAHEIQNPLNFVNNFSDVNKELLTELKDEADRGNIDEVKAIANDVIDNEEKISHHGKRADAIVKGMLQHSRKSTGQKEPTDINALCDEYLRLSYHGMRAKDKNFNADFKTDFDKSLSAGEAGIGKINIVPQDIGRVLLNLYNNAFYAVNEKRKTADENYKPLVTVATRGPSPLQKGWVEVVITDNGNGIPQNIVAKIFQPFFTTKPTGEGTGLGLSLSYDIIKAHGGEIKVETKEGERSNFTMFIIQLPIK